MSGQRLDSYRGRIIMSSRRYPMNKNAVFVRKRASMPVGLSNQIFASKYVLYMPDKEQLIAQVEAVLEKWHGSEEH